MEIKDWITLICTCVIAIGWFVTDALMKKGLRLEWVFTPAHLKCGSMP